MTLLDQEATSATLLSYVDDVRRVLAETPVHAVARIVQTILDAHERGAHIYILGNGGSASTASHFACDLSKATITGGHSRLRVTALTDNVALLTAWANDTTYDRVFAEQLRSLATAGDVVLAISASGNSPNVIAAARTARDLGATTVALVGFAGGVLKQLADTSIHVLSDDYGVVEDCHLVLQHAITLSVRRALQA